MYYRPILFIAAFLLSTQLPGQQVTFSYRSELLDPVSGFTAYADCAVDMNQDQLDDVVRIGSKGIFIDFQQKDQTFSQQFYPVLVKSPPTWSVCAGDLNNDGYNDLLFADTETVSFVMAGDAGSSYSESVTTAELISQRSTLADIDNDGWLDAFVCNDTSMSVPFRNLGMGEMVVDTTLVSTSSLAGSYSAIWTDYDNDGDIDLYITKCLSGASPGDPRRTNLLYRNVNTGEFVESAQQAGLDDNAQSWSTVFADFDNDGDMDAFVVNHDSQNRLFRNDGDGTFTNVIATSGIDADDLGAFECVAGDFNNDGFIDLFSELQNELYLGNGDLTFSGQDAPSPPGAVADLNNDGYLDITRLGQVWLNDGNQENHWIKLGLIGDTSNRNGIGARLEIYGPWGIQVREVRSGEGYSPMHSLTVHFGLGQAEEVDSLVVRWPSGVVTSLRELPADVSYLVPESECLLSAEMPDEQELLLCPGDSLELVAPSGYVEYIWSNGDTTRQTLVSDPGTYYVWVTDSAGCRAITDLAVVSMREEPRPEIHAIPSRRACLGDSIILVASNGSGFIWSDGQFGDSVRVGSSGVYTVVTEAICTDEILTSREFVVEILPADVPPNVQISSSLDSIYLVAEGENCHWYNQESGGTLLHTGCEWILPISEEDTLIYVESQPFYSGEMISGGKTDTSGGATSLQTGYMLFEAWQPFTLHSVRVFVPDDAPEGLRFVQLFSPDTLLAFRQFEVTRGWNELVLDFEVPVGEFSLHCPHGNLYRDTGILNYPYAIGEAGQITNSSYGEEYYYYFYDWKIRTEDMTCISDRIPVQLTTVNTENHGHESVRIFPNPSSGVLNVHIDDEDGQGGTVKILDIQGRLLGQEVIGTKRGERIDLSGLDNGMYLVIVERQSSRYVRRVILQ